MRIAKPQELIMLLILDCGWIFSFLCVYSNIVNHVSGSITLVVLSIIITLVLESIMSYKKWLLCISYCSSLLLVYWYLGFPSLSTFYTFASLILITLILSIPISHLFSAKNLFKSLLVFLADDYVYLVEIEDDWFIFQRPNGDYIQHEDYTKPGTKVKYTKKKLYALQIYKRHVAISYCISKGINVIPD